MSSRRSRNLTDYSHAGLRHKLLLLSPALVLAIAVGTALGSPPDLKSQQVLADVERRIIEQRQIVEQQRKGSALRDNPTYGAPIPKRTELQGQHAALINRQQLTDKHPRVLAISDQIQAINRQIEELRRQDSALVSQSPQARELATRRSERNRLKIELEITGRELVGRSSDQSVAPAPEPQLVRFRAWLE